MTKYIFLFVIAFTAFTSYAQNAKMPSFVTDSLDSYIKKGLELWQIPGISVAIVKDGEVIYAKGHGVTKVGGTEKVNENTLFMIGSNTKAFTAAALAILQDEGKLNMNDKVQKYLPDFKLKDPLASKNVNIGDLLSHRIGFETFQGDFTYWTSTLTRKEVMQKMSLIDAPYDFRTKWGYCNAAFLTAGEVTEKVSGSSWENYVRQSILNPLKMSSTLMLAEELKKASNAATPHSFINGKMSVIPIPDLDNLGPAASMSSNATDMSKWLFALINKEKTALSSKAMMAIRQPYSTIRVDGRDKQLTHFSLYGLGLEIKDRNGKMVYSHTGGVDGFFSSLMFVPEENLGIVVMTNNDQNNFYVSLSNEIRDAFLGLPYFNFSEKSYKGFEANKAKERANIDSLKQVIAKKNAMPANAENIAGEYQNEVYGKIEVKMDKKKNLSLHFSNHPNLVGTLEHISNGNFLCSYNNPTFGVVQIPFKVENGKVKGMTLVVADFVEFTTYDFKKI